MAEERFDSSDSVRSAAALKHAQQVTFDEPLKLELGGQLPSVTVTYETYGRLSEAADNAVLICHAISGDSHVARHDEADDPGWWDLARMVGQGRPIDTDRYFVICPNLLGSCRGTTGPNSINPGTGAAWGRDFPTITVGDLVAAQRRLIDHLGVGPVLAVVGGSLGGHQVIQWAVSHPQRVRSAIAIASSPRLTSQALAFDVIGRNAIMHDPNYAREGDWGAGPNVGLAIARMLGHITYLSREAMRQKFEGDRFQPREAPAGFEKKFSVGSYLAHQGVKFVERFDANSYVALSMAMDLFDLGATKAELVEALRPSTCRWLIVSFMSDWLFPPDQSEALVEALVAADKAVGYCNVQSHCGHDAFLLPDDVGTYGSLIGAFLANVSGQGEPPGAAGTGGEARDVKSIFHQRRLDYDLIMELIAPAASVLDLGCGSGGLLARLAARGGHPRLVGVELDQQAIIDCVRLGLDVIQADLNEGRLPFADKQFDSVVLSLTLQAVRDVRTVVDDMLRVGRECVVSFPNLAYRRHRETLAVGGRAPETSGLPAYSWHDTPNIRFLSIADFEDFCAEHGVRVHRRVFLDTEAGEKVTAEPNRNANLAIFVISR